MDIYNRANARRSLVDTVVFRVISQIATVLAYVVMVRGMSREDFGVFNLLYSFIPVIGTVASFGLEQTLRRYQPEYLRAGNHVAASWLVKIVASARLGTTATTIVIILALWNWFAPLFKVEPYRPQFALFSLLLLLHYQTGILQLSLASRMLHRFSVGSLTLLAYAKLIAYLSFLWFDSLTLVNAIVSDTVAYGLAYASLRIFYARNRRKEPKTGQMPSKEDKKRMIRYGFFNNFNDAGTMLLSSKTDNFFIAAFIDPISVAIYSFYTRLGELISHLLPGRLFQNVIHPMFFAIDRNEAERRLPRYFSLLLNLNLVLQWPILAFTAAYNAELVTLVFGVKYVEYSMMLPLVLAFITLNLIATPATLVAQYEEKAGIILLSKIFTAYNVIALIVLVPLAGVYGAAVATGTAQLFKNLFIWWFVRRNARWLNFRQMLLNSLMIWGGVVAVAYALKWLLPLPALAHLCIGVLLVSLGLLIYVRSDALSQSDRQILGNVLHGKEARLLHRFGILRHPRSRDRRDD